MKKGILIAVLLICTAMSFADRGAGYFYGNVTGAVTGTEFVIRVVDVKGLEWVEDARDYPGSYITDEALFYSANNPYTIHCDLYDGDIIVRTQFRVKSIPVGGGNVEVNFCFLDAHSIKP